MLIDFKIKKLKKKLSETPISLPWSCSLSLYLSSVIYRLKLNLWFNVILHMLSLFSIAYYTLACVRWCECLLIRGSVLAGGKWSPTEVVSDV